MNTVLVTGAAGFIGMHACARLLARGVTVVGIDNLNAYYDPALKEARLARLLPHPNFRFERLDIADRQALPELFARVRPARVLHLAAQAGVRYSIDQPDAVKNCPNIRIVPTAPMFAQAILNIWNGTSVSSLFEIDTLSPIYEGLYTGD